ncbi:uncharacterized protein [Haliotis asinina]|uniref:uncharacterized protein n=1 Tax=Haliotis asinina TaxID=109174 RepID=UPI003531B6BF
MSKPGNYSQCNGHGDFNTSTSRCRCRHGYIGDACDELAEDCSEAFSVGQYRDEIGVFYVQPSPLIHPFTALCSMKWLGRTYVMFNANYFPFVDFNRNWYDYKHGFGDLRQASTAQNGNFWIGNELLHYVTNNRRHTLIVDARFPEGMYLQYQYYGFVVKSEEEGYAFTFEFGGPQPEYALGDGLTLANGTKFSTYDVDNDLSGDNCADIHQSGWWFTTCGGYNPTGKPQPSSDSYMSFKEQGDEGTCYLNSNVGLSDTGCVNQYQTFMLDNEEDQVCNGHGVYLMDVNKCRCFDGYIGDSCDRLMQDCSEGSDHYLEEEGIFFIHPRLSTSVFRVYCNMIWGGRTYLMIISRNGPYVNFTRSWQDYIDGFGVSEGVESVRGEADGYAFSFDYGYPNLDGEGIHILGDYLTQANGTKFSTYDVDNDLSIDNCADIHQSGWWFTACGDYNPTGQPQHGKFLSFDPISLSWPVNGNFTPSYIHIFLQYR